MWIQCSMWLNQLTISAHTHAPMCHVSLTLGTSALPGKLEPSASVFILCQLEIFQTFSFFFFVKDIWMEQQQLSSLTTNELWEWILIWRHYALWVINISMVFNISIIWWYCCSEETTPSWMIIPLLKPSSWFIFPPNGWYNRSWQPMWESDCSHWSIGSTKDLVMDVQIELHDFIPLLIRCQILKCDIQIVIHTCQKHSYSFI